MAPPWLNQHCLYSYFNMKTRKTELFPTLNSVNSWHLTEKTHISSNWKLKFKAWSRLFCDGSITSVDVYIMTGFWWRLGFRGSRKCGVHLVIKLPCSLLIRLQLVLLLVSASLWLFLAILLTLRVHHLQQKEGINAIFDIKESVTLDVKEVQGFQNDTGRHEVGAENYAKN